LQNERLSNGGQSLTFQIEPAKIQSTRILVGLGHRPIAELVARI